MTPKEFLQQYCDAEDAISAKLSEIHNLRELATKITQTISGDPVQGSTEDKTATIVAKIVDMEKEVDDEIGKLQIIKQRVKVTIEAVEDTRMKKILFRRYICGEKWELIAVKLNFDYSWVLRLHGEALQKIIISD